MIYIPVNKLARNLVEDAAEAAKERYLRHTLGLGSSLTSATGPDSEFW